MGADRVCLGLPWADRVSGFTPKTRQVIKDRSGGACELCGRSAYGGSIHHRRPRGMGGNKTQVANSPSNGIVLCGHALTPDGCHYWVESNRVKANELGLLLFQHQTPVDVPVRLHLGWVMLDDNGGYVYQNHGGGNSNMHVDEGA